MMLIIHIGYHKTGSTAIQSFLEKNRDTLAREGIIYPNGTSSWIGHPELAWAFDAKKYEWQDKNLNHIETIDYYMSFLQQSMHSDKTIIISSEEFCRLEFDHVAFQRFFEYIVTFNPIIIGYGRDASSFLLSRYRHEVQMGAETRPLRDFLANFDNLQSAAFQVRMRVWEQAFPNSCIFRDYQKETSAHGSIVKSFLALADVRVGSLVFEAEDAERKLHPLLADAARAVARSDLQEEQQKGLFDSLFALGDQLPPISETDVLQELALSQELRTILASLGYGSVNLERTLDSVISSRSTVAT